MAEFTLTSGADTYNLDTAGNVTADGAAAGTWTTNQQNQIVISKPDGTSLFADAIWQFNNANQLTVQPAGAAAAFSFASDAALRNSYTTVDSALQVAPDKAAPFTFALHGGWNLNPDHNLEFTCNSLVSVITGFVSDPIGRFIFHFADKEFPLRTSVLGFAGSWDVPRDANNQPIVTGDANLVFRYANEDGSAGVFQLPESATLIRTTNQLAYTYQKENRTLTISFQGTLMVDPDLQITYTFNRQVSSTGSEMVGSTTIGFAAMLTRPDFTLDLELSLLKADGTAGSTLTIGGNFRGVLGKTKLLVGFSFQQTFGTDGVITRSAAFTGDLTFSGGEVQWTFQTTGQTVTLALNVDVKLGDASLDARLNLDVENGHVVGITFLLGISF